MEIFDPNDIGMPNGNFFALPYTLNESEIVLVAVPWDVTTSYRAGTAKGPNAIVQASAQIDLFDADVENAWQIKIGTHPYNEAIESKSEDLRKYAEDVIEHLEDGGDPEEKSIVKKINAINEGSELLNKWLYDQAASYIEQGKIVAVVGGEHSVPFGLIKCVSEKFDRVGVLHIDAHADLRHAYEGFEYSHASIMYNVITKCTNVEKLVQVGIRDFCADEAKLISTNAKIKSYTDADISERLFSGSQTWKAICNEIVAALPNNVYVSFDIDGLSPDLCPHTGTPVPGGLSFQQAHYLLKTLAKSGKRIVAFDLNEVAPNPNEENDEFDANIGARMLYKLCCLAHLSNEQK